MFQQVPGVVNCGNSMVRHPVVDLEASKEICEELDHPDVEQKGVSHDMKSQKNTMNVE